MHILLIEDEHSIALPLGIALNGAGFIYTHCVLAMEGLNVLKNQSIDLVILDIGLPDMNGLHALKTLREFSQVPVLVLTARAEEADKLFGLELGADDYVTKPFSPKEVIARIKAITKRTAIPQTATIAATAINVLENACTPANSDSLRTKPLIINCQTLSVSLLGQVLQLTPAEFRILAALAQAPGVVSSRDQLLAILGQNCAVYERNIDTHIKTLRAKCRNYTADEVIKTHRGFGYSLVLAVHLCP
jgi:two-component system, OmpR family, catabolic regulation response regulator CreB